MRSAVAELRAAHLEAIEDNPTDLEIAYDVRERHEGAFRNEKGIYRVRARLYQEATGARAVQIVGDVSGDKQIDARWGLLLPVEIETAEGGLIRTETIKPSPTATYLFEHPRHGKYKITELHPREDYGEVWGWAATIERTK